MSLKLAGQVGPSISADGTCPAVRQGRAGELVVTTLHGDLYETAKRGNLFIVSTPAAGVTVPIYTNAVQQFVIYNPISSGVDLVISRVWLGYVSGTMAAGHYCYAASVNQGTPATVTQALVQSSKFGANPSTSSGAGNKGLYYSPATPSVALVAGNYLRAMGSSQVVQAATATNAPWTAVDICEGGIIVPPLGIFVVAANVAAASVSVISALVEEVPI